MEQSVLADEEGDEPPIEPRLSLDHAKAGDRGEAGASTSDSGKAVVPKNVTGQKEEEDALVDEMRSILKSDPKRAEQLGRTHQKKFPDGARRDEADALLVYALYNQRRLYKAQREALEYYRRHPEGEYTIKLIKLTHITPPSPRDQ